MFSSQASSKLILAGEHGVVYGGSALTTRLIWETRCQLSTATQAHLKLNDGSEQDWRPDTLHQHWQTLQARHQDWQATNNPIIQNLFDLPLAVLAWWQTHYTLPSLAIHLQSDIPIGQGLGSSASLIIAMLKGLMQASGISFTLQQLQTAATELEQLAHGKSSGLDVAAILLADRLFWQPTQITLLPNYPLTGYLVDTGKANSSTADCVGWVKQHAKNKPLWATMESATRTLKQALSDNALNAQQQAIQTLHQLLCSLGVVPKKVAQFASAAQQQGWSGKLCGAGSIRGDGGGFFWLLADAEPDTLCHEYGYQYWRLSELSQIAMP
jgi:mevalonate kinase